MQRFITLTIGAVLICSPFAAAQTVRPLTFEVFAGSGGGACSRDGVSSEARFNRPGGIAIDGAGNAYLADAKNHTIRRITPSGVVTTVAGRAGSSGYVNGSLVEALFNEPADVAIHPDGSIYVADAGNDVIRRISPAGFVSTVGPEPGSGFNQPNGIDIDDAGNVYVADSARHVIRKITNGTVSTIAGMLDVRGDAGGQGSAARFYYPYDVAVDADGIVYVADYQNQLIRRIDGGFVDTLAGLSGAGGSADGTGANARFLYPWGIAVDASGDLYVSEDDNQLVRKITIPSGTVSTVAGVAQTAGHLDGPAAAATFHRPRGVAVAPDGSIWISEMLNHSVRRVDGGIVTTIAGLPPAGGTANGPRLDARFLTPAGVAVDTSGSVFVADTADHTIRKIAPDGNVTTFAGASGVPGLVNAKEGTARFSSPVDLAIDASDILYLADIGNDAVRRIAEDGTVTTLATVTASSIDYPMGIGVGPGGNLYAAVPVLRQILQITPEGVVTVWAGTGSRGYGDGPRLSASFTQPRDIAFDSAGNAYVTDSDYIRKISAAGAVSTHSIGYTGFAPALTHIAVDAFDLVVFADGYVLRTMTSSGGFGQVGGTAGVPGTCSGTGANARFETVGGIAATASGELYLTDSSAHKVILATEAIQTLATATPQTTSPGATIQLAAVPPSDASEWLWSVVARPEESTSTLSSATIANPTFVVDQAGLYKLELRASNATGVRISTVDVTACTPLTNVVIETTGSTAVCRLGSGSRGGWVYSATDGNCGTTYQWGFRTVSGGDITPLSGETDPSYEIQGWRFSPGIRYLVVTATPAGGAARISNEIPITVTEAVAAINADFEVGAYSKGNVASADDAGAEATYAWTITNGTIVSGQGTSQITFDAAVDQIRIDLTVTLNGCVAGATDWVNVLPGPRFNLVTPCRIIDSRTSTSLAGGTTRTVAVAGKCGIPAGARAVTANITAVQPVTEGWFALYPAGSVWGGTSTMNYRAGKTRANNAVVPLSEDGGIEVRNGSTAATHFLIDVSGYFQ